MDLFNCSRRVQRYQKQRTTKFQGMQLKQIGGERFYGGLSHEDLNH